MKIILEEAVESEKYLLAINLIILWWKDFLIRIQEKQETVKEGLIKKHIARPSKVEVKRRKVLEKDHSNKEQEIKKKL
jgi:hypothetical protein